MSFFVIKSSMNKDEFRHKVFSLSERLYPMVCRLLGNTANAEDAIQEIMMKLWVRRKQVGKHPNITAYVFLTARNYCIDLLKKKNLPIDAAASQLRLLESDNRHDELEWRELNALIYKILEKLPRQQQDVLIMRDIDGCEFAEIAATMQLKVEHIRVLLSRARKQVGLELETIYSNERRGN